MKFFRKSAPEKIEQPDSPVPTVSPDITSTTTPNLTPEETARKWFTEKFGTDMPEEVTRTFRQIAQAEAKRQKAGEQVLDPNELKRIQDSIRLYKTKLTNITQTLNGLQAQKEWLHKFKELNATLEKYRQAFFESNKNYNAHLKEIRELERFETFEAVLGNYQRIKAKENVLHFIRKGSALHAEKLTEALSADKANQKKAETENKKYQEAWHNLQQIQKTLAEGYRLQAALRFHEADLKELSDYKERIEQALSTVQKQGKETAEELKKNKEQAAQQQQQLQNLESLQSMLEKGEAIQTRLNFLQSRKKRKEQLQTVLERTLRKQHEQDEKLNKLFLSSQGIDAQINTLQSELQVHQKSIVGMNSYNLQQRAMDLKSKKEMLTNATRLWKQIAEGYNRVDEKSQEIMRMRHHNDALKAQIAKLEPETAGLQRQCEELKYAYTLSKSQDVMQLRKDLQEGVSCSVCGATHHPYHSDTLLEQSKLIGEIKIEFEQAATELKHKQSLLDELRREQAVEEGRIEMCHQALETYKQILQDHVAHWEDFVALDRSFKDCSASTNFEGRRIMLQQLMEKTGVDAEDAQKELDTFNYHQSNINALNEKIALKEQEKDEIAVRLNEVNTGCQVVAYRVEQLQQSLSRTNGQYSELFEEIDKMMAISNWYKVWTENPENLYPTADGTLVQPEKRYGRNQKRDHPPANLAGNDGPVHTGFVQTTGLHQRENRTDVGIPEPNTRTIIQDVPGRRRRRLQQNSIRHFMFLGRTKGRGPAQSGRNTCPGSPTPRLQPTYDRHGSGTRNANRPRAFGAGYLDQEIQCPAFPRAVLRTGTDIQQHDRLECPEAGNQNPHAAKHAGRSTGRRSPSGSGRPSSERPFARTGQGRPHSGAEH